MFKFDVSMIVKSGDTTLYAEFIAKTIQLYKIAKWILMTQKLQTFLLQTVKQNVMSLFK